METSVEQTRESNRKLIEEATSRYPPPSEELVELSQRRGAAVDVVMQFAEIRAKDIHPRLPDKSLLELYNADIAASNDEGQRRIFATTFGLAPGGLLTDIILKSYYRNPEMEREARIHQRFLEEWFRPAIEILQKDPRAIMPDHFIPNGTPIEFRNKALKLLQNGAAEVQKGIDEYRSTSKPGKRGNVSPATAFALFGDLTVRTLLLFSGECPPFISRDIGRRIGGAVNRFVIDHREAFELWGSEDRLPKLLGDGKSRLKREIFSGQRPELIEFCESNGYSTWILLDYHQKLWGGEESSDQQR